MIFGSDVAEFQQGLDSIYVHLTWDFENSRRLYPISCRYLELVITVSVRCCPQTLDQDVTIVVD